MTAHPAADPTAIAFVDLDNTLVYSAAAIARWAPPGVVYRCVELRDGVERGFVTAAAALELERLEPLVTLVPVTARSREQYDRLDLLRGIPAAAIVSNGALVLSGGTPDPLWESVVGSALAAAAPIGEAAAVMSAFAPRERDGRILVATFDDRAGAQSCLEAVDARLAALHWSAQRDARRVYATPAGLSKATAAAHVIATMPHALVLAAGDSALDAGLLALADEAMVPAHGELATETIGSISFGVTRLRGPAAGEEICRWIAVRSTRE